MTEFLSMIAVLFIIWFMFFRTKNVESNPELEEPVSDGTIINRSVEIVGTYQGLQISKELILSDGRSYEYEGIAVLKSNGLYSSSDPDKHHILVDNCLLYKQVLQTG